MLLASGPSFEWMSFFQILSWIVLPFLLGVIFLTILFHYRKKRKSISPSEEKEDDFILASPEQFVHTKEDGEYVFFDHTNLILEYKKRMFYNHAKYISLQKDYIALETRFSSLVSNTDRKSIKIHKTNLHMKNLREQTSPAELANIPGDVNVMEEKRELLDKLEKLNRSYQRLQEENRFLQEQVTLQTASDDEKEKIVNRWKDENKMLRDKIAEKEYLQDLVEEKAAQITFLQSQTEQRIKNQHHADQQRVEAIRELERLQEPYKQSLQQIDTLKNELVQRQSDSDKLLSILSEKEGSLSFIEQDLISKSDRVTCLENELHEIKNQNDLLHAEVADSKDLAITLKDQLDKEQSRANYLEQKLKNNKQLLKRLYNEISSSVELEEDTSPVIEFSKVYNNIEPAAS